MASNLRETLQHSSESHPANGRSLPASTFAESSHSQMLIRAIAHDLRAPLRNMRHISRSLADDLGERRSMDIGSDLQRLTRLAEKTSRMVDELLLTSGLKHQPRPIQLVKLDELVEDAIDLGDYASNTSINVGGPVFRFFTSKPELALVMRNVIGNAIRHRHDDFGTVTIGANQEAMETMVFSVIDDGPGLPKSILDWINCASHEPSGNPLPALGLVLAVSMVRTNGGSICARPALSNGEGTEIRWTWPARALDG